MFQQLLKTPKTGFYLFKQIKTIYLTRFLCYNRRMKLNNYQIFCNKIKEVSACENKPSVLLHCCCAPCSTACILQLKDYFDITVFYYNPNISPKQEYEKRKAEQINYINQIAPNGEIKFEDCDYVPTEFYSIAKGLELCPEKGERCLKCYKLRMEETCKRAKEKGYDYFATTLTLSPLKEEKDINRIGIQLQEEYEMPYLVSNFKKNNGYLNSINLSKQYNLYRQDYCGCVYSKQNKTSHFKN